MAPDPWQGGCAQNEIPLPAHPGKRRGARHRQGAADARRARGSAGGGARDQRGSAEQSAARASARSRAACGIACPAAAGRARACRSDLGGAALGCEGCACCPALAPGDGHQIDGRGVVREHRGQPRTAELCRGACGQRGRRARATRGSAPNVVPASRHRARDVLHNHVDRRVGGDVAVAVAVAVGATSPTAQPAMMPQSRQSHVPGGGSVPTAE
mmetsp:Transcript_19490/g.50299  ORF Transcript_19490/g.50299 Transcript_19490/m.50299 type:complete len:214 (+) Transcript_19490:917-1558(+)